MSRPASSLLWAVLVVVWLGVLAVRPLYKPDEARYGEIPREMVASGDWLTPRLNGFKYFEKPPLQYWATAAAYKIFGVSDWAARLWTALTALAGIALVGVTASRLFGPPAGTIAAALLASSPLYLLLGQINTLDMGVAFFLSAAVFAFALAQREDEPPARRRRLMLGFWAGCAAAVLSKGLIGILLPCAAIGFYVVVRRDWKLLSRLELLRGVPLFLLITAPWFVAVSLANREFAYFFFVQEHLLRFTTHVHQRQHPHWYFIPILIVGVWPWLLACFAGWFAALRPGPGRAFSPALFLGLWAVVVFAFFSVSGSKLPPYILPMVPALAVLAGGYLAGAERRGLLIAQAPLLAVAAIAAGGGAWYLTSQLNPYGLGAAYAPWLAAVAGVFFAGSATAAVLAVRGRGAQALASIAVSASAALFIGFAGYAVFAPAYSVSALVASLPQPPSRNAAIFTVETYDHTIPWVLRRPVTMVKYRDELAQAIDWEPARFIPELEGFRRAWAAEREAYAFVAVRDFERLRGELGGPMEIAARGTRYLIVRKPQ